MRLKSDLVLGIDPGFAIIGWAVLSLKQAVVAYGHISTAAGLSLPERMMQIADQLETIITQYQPAALAIEKLFYFKNAKTVINVAQSRGLTLYLAASLGLSVAEYTPLEVKTAITGYGRADKQQVQRMVVKILGLNQVPKPDDTADALAVAYTHTVYYRRRALINQGLQGQKAKS